jgi:hypothetical protein
MEIESVKPVITDVPDEICVLPYLDQKTKSALSLVSKDFYDIVLVSYTRTALEIWVSGRKSISFCYFIKGVINKIKKLEKNNSLLLSIHAKKEFPFYILFWFRVCLKDDSQLKELHFSNGDIKVKHLKRIENFENLEKVSFVNARFIGKNRSLDQAFRDLPKNLKELNLSGSPSICYLLSSIKDRRSGIKDRRFLSAIEEIKPKKLVLSEDFVRVRPRLELVVRLRELTNNKSGGVELIKLGDNAEMANSYGYDIRETIEIVEEIEKNMNRLRNLLWRAITEKDVQELENSDIKVIIQSTSQ